MVQYSAGATQAAHHSRAAALRRRHAGRRLFPSLLVLAVAVLTACSKDKTNPIKPLEGVAPDFSLRDLNPNSASYDSLISPRQFTTKISAWYFGDAT